jgi:hypothetical protein
MADDPDVPSLLDLEDQEPVSRSAPAIYGRPLTAPYQTMSYTPNYSPAGGSHGHSHGGGGGGDGHGHSHGGYSSEHMQQMQAFLSSLSPEQLNELRTRAQSFSHTGAFPPDLLQTLSRSQPGLLIPPGAGGGPHGHSHGGQPCHGHGAQSVPAFPSLQNAEVELLHRKWIVRNFSVFRYIFIPTNLEISIVISFDSCCETRGSSITQTPN